MLTKGIPEQASIENSVRILKKALRKELPQKIESMKYPIIHYAVCILSICFSASQYIICKTYFSISVERQNLPNIERQIVEERPIMIQTRSESDGFRKGIYSQITDLNFNYKCSNMLVFL